jgi:hypothetical protein
MNGTAEKHVINPLNHRESKKGIGYVIFVLPVLKRPKHENFGSEFLTPSKPMRMGNYSELKPNS